MDFCLDDCRMAENSIRSCEMEILSLVHCIPNAYKKRGQGFPLSVVYF